MKIKTVGGILAKPAPKKGKERKGKELSPLKHFIWYKTFTKMTIATGRFLKRRAMLV